VNPADLTPVACQTCEALFTRAKKWQRFCSEICQRRASLIGPQKRLCKVCRAEFVRSGRGQSNRWHCSEACAAESARRARAEFKKRRPERDATYREKQKAKRQRDTALERLWRKHPEMPRCCEACGESRVLDIAHRPEHRRNGPWKTMANTTPEKIWVLCPSCHALLDRLNYTPEQLGIKERAWAC
jgi:hypothetical protein